MQQENLHPLRIPQAELIAWLQQVLAQQQMQAAPPQGQQPQIPAQSAPLPRHHQQGGPLIPVPPPQPIPPPEWLARGTVAGDVARALTIPLHQRSWPVEMGHLSYARQQLAPPPTERPLVDIAFPEQRFVHNPLAPVIPHRVAFDRGATRPVLPPPVNTQLPGPRQMLRFILPQNWLGEVYPTRWGGQSGVAVNVGRTW